MQKKFIVIDQGYYRDPRLSEMIADEPDLQFVIPDVAFIEMCKSYEWEITIRKSLEYLSECPARVVAAKSIGESLQIEVQRRRSVDGFLVCRNFTPVVRALLKEIRDGKDGPAFESFRAEVEGIRRDLSNEDLNHQRNLETLRGLANVTEQAIGVDLLKALRNQSLQANEIAELAVRTAPNLMQSFFREAEFPGNRVKSFIKSQPMTYRLILLRFWLSLEWVRLGGLDSLKETKATNEFLDQDYVLLASFFDGIRSKDDRVNRAYVALIYMLNK